MKYRRLGGTDLEVSVICLGPMRAAARQAGNDDKSKQGARGLRAALEGGVNFVHSSYEYGTRWMMGPVLKEFPGRSDLHHVIKVPVPDFKDEGRFDADKFRMMIEEALRELHAERISVLQWMWRSDPNSDELRIPMLGGIIDDVCAAFEKMRDQGKAGYLMTFPYTVGCARAALETGRFAGIIAYYNMLEMEMAEIFDELEQREMGFMSIRPLYQGLLTDRRKDWAALKADDRLAGEEYKVDFARRDRMVAELGEEIGESMTSFALRFALAHRLVASLVVGINTEEQAEEILAAVLDGDFPGEDMVERVLALWREGFGV